MSRLERISSQASLLCALDINKRLAMVMLNSLGRADMISQWIPNFNINALFDDGRTILMRAACDKEDSLMLIQLLLEFPSIDVNLTSSEGFTALNYARKADRWETANVLLRHLVTQGLGGDLLAKAAMEGDKQLLKSLLAIPGIDINATDSSGKTALMWSHRYYSAFRRCKYRKRFPFIRS